MPQRGKRTRVFTIPIFSSESGAGAAAMRLLCAARLEDRKDQMRIDEVRRLTSQTDHSMIDITMSVGYCSPSHFACVFRQLAGMTPSVQSVQAAGAAASQRGTRLLDHRQQAAVDHQRDAGHVARHVRAEPDDGVADLGRLA